MKKVILWALVSIASILLLGRMLNPLFTEKAYNKAIDYYKNGEFVKAIEILSDMLDYKDSHSIIKKCWDEVAERKTVSAEDDFYVGLKSDGTVIAYGENNRNQCSLEDWTNIIAIDTDNNHTYGLKSDGTVLVSCSCTGRGSPDPTGKFHPRACDIKNWTDIVAISAGGGHTVGLKSDGTVVAVGFNYHFGSSYKNGPCDVDKWENIVAISANREYTLGLKSDGTIVFAGEIDLGKVPDTWKNTKKFNEWNNIKKIATCPVLAVGLRNDGTVVAIGESKYYDAFSGGWRSRNLYKISDWTDIVNIAVSGFHIIGIKSDGTIVENCYKNGHCNINKWENISYISTEDSGTIGVTKTGSVITNGDDWEDKGVKEWTDIMPANN